MGKRKPRGPIQNYSNDNQLVGKILTSNFLQYLRPILDSSGYYIEPESMKLKLIPRNQGIRVETPWIYVSIDTSMKCYMFHDIASHMGFVPQRCMECWKVVVAPRSIMELFKLLELEEFMAEQNPACHCKCGTEQREYVPRHYGGYFYCRGKKQGLRRLKQVREAVDEYINPQVSVLLKRYCTEFELKFGPSDQYERPPHADAIEKELWENSDLPPGGQMQPEYVKRLVIMDWIRYAYKSGDPVAFLYNMNQPLYTPSITYTE